MDTEAKGRHPCEEEVDIGDAATNQGMLRMAGNLQKRGKRKEAWDNLSLRASEEDQPWCQISSPLYTENIHFYCFRAHRLPSVTVAP